MGDLPYPSGSTALVIRDVPGGGSDGKESACSAGDVGSVPGLGRSPGGRHGNPLQYSCLKNPHEHRSLAGYSPEGCKGLDVTEHSTGLFLGCPPHPLCLLAPKAAGEFHMGGLRGGK